MARPAGVTVTTIMMCFTNFLGFFLVNWAPRPRHHPGILFAMYTVIIMIGYVALWHFWIGKNWARWLVFASSLLALWNLWGLRKPVPPQFYSAVRVPMVLAEGLIALFLIVYLNLPEVRDWFTSKKRTPWVA